METLEGGGGNIPPPVWNPGPTVMQEDVINMYNIFSLSYYSFIWQTVINPVENGADLIQENIAQLHIIMNRVKADRQNTNPLTMKLNGTLDAAVQGGVANFDVSGNIPCVCLGVFLCVHVYNCIYMCVCVCVVVCIQLCACDNVICMSI